jgi:hypothetical protein
MQNIFLNTFYENASVFRWEQNDDGVFDLFLIPDHERFLSNRQITHWNLKVESAPEAVGQTATFRFRHVSGCWNGHEYETFSHGDIVTAFSSDGKNWRTVKCVPSSHPDCGLEFSIEIESECVQVARLVPYTNSMLQQTIRELSASKDFKVYNVGSTVEGRPLEMIEIGNPEAEHQILLRGRAHPWESGGSWFLEGLMRKLVPGAPDQTTAIRNDVCFCIMPMACKDGVCRGMRK